MKKNKFLAAGIFAAISVLSNNVVAAVITNGTFDSNLSGWSQVTNGGTVQWNAGQAVFTTGSGVAPFSAVLVQGDDGNFSFPNPILLGATNSQLTFDAVFSQSADASETGIGSNDSFQVLLYDANGGSDVSLASLDALTLGTHFAFDLSPYLGRSVALSFELNDENDGFNTQVNLDNVSLTAVPLPGAFYLQLLGFFGFLARRKAWFAK